MHRNVTNFFESNMKALQASLSNSAIRPNGDVDMSKSIPVIIKWLLALFMVLTLLPCWAMADLASYLDEQLIQAAKRGDLDRVKTLIEIAEREKETIQIGRTHGQHAD